MQFFSCIVTIILTVFHTHTRSHSVEDINLSVRIVVNINDKSLESNQKCLYLNYILHARYSLYNNLLNDMRQMNGNEDKAKKKLNETKTEEMAHMIHMHIFFFSSL